MLTSRGAIEGERKHVTVLFADVCGFTGLSEQLDPEEVHGLMDRCFEILMREIHRFEGTINQFTGDGVMALFGAPVAHEDAPQRAIRAALGIQGALREQGADFPGGEGAAFQMRIGIDTGTVVVGKIGDDLRMDYTAAGDTTNLAARLQAAAEPGTVLVSENTHRLTKDFFEFSHAGPIEVKGKKSPVAVYGAIRPKAVRSRMEAAARRGLTPLVARDAEIGHLMTAFAKVKEGHGQIVSLVGEAGVGKSRLAHEFKKRLRGEGHHPLRGLLPLLRPCHPLPARRPDHKRLLRHHGRRQRGQDPGEGDIGLKPVGLVGSPRGAGHHKKARIRHRLSQQHHLHPGEGRSAAGHQPGGIASGRASTG